MKLIVLDDWSLIPGPERDPPTSSLALSEIVEYPLETIAAALLSFPGMKVEHPAKPTWWDWIARWKKEDSFIEFGMTLFETEPVSWGGSSVKGQCTLDDFMQLWNVVRKRCPGVWMHNEECEIHTPESFTKLFGS